MNAGNALPAATRALLFAALLVSQSSAHAHGEQIIFMPIGQVIALLPVAIIAAWAVREIVARIAVVLAAVGIAVLFWVLPNGYMPWWALATSLGSFLTGLLPPLMIASVVAWIARVFQGSEEHGT